MEHEAASHMECQRQTCVRVCLAAVGRPIVDSLKELEDSGPLPLAHGLHAGLRRQALFVKDLETMPKQHLAGVARLREPAGSRRVDQQQREERLQFHRQREQGQDHDAGSGDATTKMSGCMPDTLVPGFTKYQVCYQALPVSTKTALRATNYQPGSSGGTTSFVLDVIFAAWPTP